MLCWLTSVTHNACSMIEECTVPVKTRLGHVSGWCKQTSLPHTAEGEAYIYFFLAYVGVVWLTSSSVAADIHNVLLSIERREVTWMVRYIR